MGDPMIGRRAERRRLATGRAGNTRRAHPKVLVGAIGFEPTTYGSQNRRATRLRYAPLGMP